VADATKTGASTGTATTTRTGSQAGQTVVRSDADTRKGRATPSRREAEAARKARLRSMPANTKEARRAQRGARNKAFYEQRQAMKAGDTKNFPLRDRGPAKAFIRDYVDRRLRLLEVLMFVVVISYLSLITRNTALTAVSTIGMEVVLFLGLTLGTVLVVRIKRAVTEQFGAADAQRIAFYVVSRAVMPRMLRQPKPTVTFTGKKKALPAVK
jgi:hypothetical protein